MMKKTLVVSFAAAALLNIACGTTKAEEKPATDTAATPDAAATPAPDAAKAPEGSCGGEKAATPEAPKN